MSDDDDEQTNAIGIIAEDAAIYGYGLVLAHADPSIHAAIERETAAHRRRRDHALTLWPGAPAPAVGYELSADLTGPWQALELAVRIEVDCCNAWRAQIVSAETDEQKHMCVDALSASAVQLARWRSIIPGTPFEAFPGFSDES